MQVQSVLLRFWFKFDSMYLNYCWLSVGSALFKAVQGVAHCPLTVLLWLRFNWFLYMDGRKQNAMIRLSIVYQISHQSCWDCKTNQLILRFKLMQLWINYTKDILDKNCANAKFPCAILENQAPSLRSVNISVRHIWKLELSMFMYFT